DGGGRVLGCDRGRDPRARRALEFASRHALRTHASRVAPQGRVVAPQMRRVRVDQGLDVIVVHEVIHSLGSHRSSGDPTWTEPPRDMGLPDLEPIARTLAMKHSSCRGLAAAPGTFVDIARPRCAPRAGSSAFDAQLALTAPR